MTYKTIDLILKCLPFMSTCHKENLTGFLLCYNNITYLLSVHHYLPIENILNDNNELSCNILVNSCWSEALIMDTYNIDTSQFTIFKKIQNNIKFFNDLKVFTIINGEIKPIDIINTIFEPFDYLNLSPEIPYLVGKLNTSEEILAGNSGSPVFIRKCNEDILIGVISKYNINTQSIYIIPIYVFIKSIEKNDNKTIYGLDCTNTVKIKSYNIVNDSIHGKTIFHPTLKINIPLSTYFLLEGDDHITFTVYNNFNKDGKKIITINNVRPISINNNLIVSHEDNLLSSNHGRFKINLRLLSLFKRVTNSEIQKILFMKIQNNINLTKSNDFWLDLKIK